MSLLIGLLSFVLFLTCLFLCLLVLVQLPKKEAGMGQAFGGGATDALFGAGAGNALTKMTKYSAGAFLILCVIIAALSSHYSRSKADLIRSGLARAAATAPATNSLATLTNLNSAVAPSVKPATAAATNAVAPAK
ncbi:MAG TPA: preprotein translocase subunit SecG [Candidatus Limnocylindria bacterium]|jgi:preprotein translocase subunit SecG|nr:preprotein translocase subunit SecG [Candidatus Limnocylindria bacterium]